MATFADLLVRIGADTKGLTTALGKMDTDLKKSQRAFNKFGGGFRDLGKQLTLGITLPVAGLAAAVGKFAGDFEQSMNNVAAKTGAVGPAFDALREKAKELGLKTKFSATQAADAMAFLGQAGCNTDEIMKGIGGTLDLAAAGGLELARAADIASNVLGGFNESASETGRVADVMAQAAANSNTSVEQLGEAMSFVAPIAKAAGLSIEETAAFIGILGDAGIQSTRAGTGLRGALAGLIKPTTESGKALKQLGIETLDAEGNMRPLQDIMAELQRAGAGNKEVFEIFTRRVATSALVMKEAADGPFQDLLTKIQARISILALARSQDTPPLLRIPRLFALNPAHHLRR